MRLTKTPALLLAAFTVWPLLYMFVFMAFMFSTFFWMGSGPPQGMGPPKMFMLIFGLHLLTILEVFALMVVYIIHLFKTDLVSGDKKALWAVVLFLGNMFAMPVYWWLYIWRPLGGEIIGDKAPGSN